MCFKNLIREGINPANLKLKKQKQICNLKDQTKNKGVNYSGSVDQVDLIQNSSKDKRVEGQSWWDKKQIIINVSVESRFDGGVYIKDGDASGSPGAFWTQTAK